MEESNDIELILERIRENCVVLSNPIKIYIILYNIYYV